MGSCFRRNDSVVIARSEATKQSIFDLAMPSDGLLRSARNDDDGAHHSLVVPAHAGTHNHKCFLEQKCHPPAPNREAAEYGFLLSQERHRCHCGAAYRSRTPKSGQLMLSTELNPPLPTSLAQAVSQ
jgi:hypothetical protein